MKIVVKKRIYIPKRKHDRDSAQANGFIDAQVFVSYRIAPPAKEN